MHTEFWKENLKDWNYFEDLAKDGEKNGKIDLKTQVCGLD
jgi:hypothetical protein